VLQADGDGLRLVAEDRLAAAGGDGVDTGEGREVGRARGGMVGEQKDAARAGPEMVELGIVEEDLWGVWIEAAKPGAVAATVNQEHRSSRARRVKEKRGAGGEFAVNDDAVARMVVSKLSV